MRQCFSCQLLHLISCPYLEVTGTKEAAERASPSSPTRSQLQFSNILLNWRIQQTWRYPIVINTPPGNDSKLIIDISRGAVSFVMSNTGSTPHNYPAR